MKSLQTASPPAASGCKPARLRASRTAARLGLAAILASSSIVAADLDIPAGRFADSEPATMMKRYWLGQIDDATREWQARYERLKTPDDVAAYQRRQRAAMVKALGDFPTRTPLLPRIVGTVARDGYRIEKVIFESRPRHFVTALLFLPDSTRHHPPHPGVLIPCGHARSAKAHDEYQSMGALLALHGMAALVFDPIDQGERLQLPEEFGGEERWGTRGHSMVGVAAILLGQNTATFEIWDGMRALDYLQSRPEIDPQKIGCTGNSGGGTQTAYLFALDDRIRASATSCYLCGFPSLLHTRGPQDAEQNLFGLVGEGVDHGDFLIIRAPAPALICAATQDYFDINGAWDVFRQVKRVYTRLGFAERTDLIENDARHNYNRTQREAVARWMSRWLRGEDRVIVEPPLRLLSDEEVRCAPAGGVLSLPGARSIYDLNDDLETALAATRASRWRAGDRRAMFADVRRDAGIRPLSEIPAITEEHVEWIDRGSHRIEKCLLIPEAGIWLPTLKFVPAQPNGRVILYLHEQGKAAEAGSGGALEKMAKAGDTVFAIDLRGTGQTKPGGPPLPGVRPHTESKDVRMAYLLGRSYVGMRAEDILACARHAGQVVGRGGPVTVHLVAVGNVGVPALHAAALEPELFTSVRISHMLHSWSHIIHNRLSSDQLVNTVHGALRHYDLPNLADALGARLSIVDSLDAVGRPYASAP